MDNGSGVVGGTNGHPSKTDGSRWVFFSVERSLNRSSRRRKRLLASKWSLLGDVTVGGSDSVVTFAPTVSLVLFVLHSCLEALSSLSSPDVRLSLVST